MLPTLDAVATRTLSTNAAVGAITGGAALAALVVTFAMATNVRVGVGLMVAICFMAIALVSLPWAIALWLGMGFVAGSFPALYPALSAAAFGLVIGWLGELIRTPSTESAGTNRRWIYVLTPALAMWLLLTLAWAEDPVLARGQWVTWARALVVFFIIATTVRKPEHVRLLVGAFVAGAVASIVLGLLGVVGSAAVQASGALEEGRLTGGAGDPNLLAAGLVPGLVLAAALVTVSRRPLPRSLAIAAIPVMVIGMVLTQSRGAFIALGAMFVAALLFTTGKRVHVLLAGVGIVVVLAAAFAAYPDALTRVTGDSAGEAGAGEKGGSGRSDLWTVAWRVAKDHPVAGVGLENYQVVAPEYVREPGKLTFVDLISDKPHVVHNTYLGLLAECGVIGLALFVALVLAALNSARRAAQRFRQAGNVSQWVLAQSVLIAAIGMLTAVFFLSDGSDPRLWVLLALAPALGSASEPPQSGDEPDWRSESGAGHAASTEGATVFP